jgi:hypothetical protein
VKLPDSVVMNHFYEHLGLNAEKIKEIEGILEEWSSDGTRKKEGNNGHGHWMNIWTPYEDSGQGRNDVKRSGNIVIY